MKVAWQASGVVPRKVLDSGPPRKRWAGVFRRRAFSSSFKKHLGSDADTATKGQTAGSNSRGTTYPNAADGVSTSPLGSEPHHKTNLMHLELRHLELSRDSTS